MEEVAAVRRAALDAVDDIAPDPLRERIADRLEGGSMAPGVLTVLSARAVERHDGSATNGTGTDLSPDAAGSDVDAEAGEATDAGFEGVVRRGAGVQLIYEGLRLTRTLAHDEPWADGVVEGPSVDRTVATNGAGHGTGGDADADADVTAGSEADMAILAADVLVARGFYLLARTEAAAAAVDVVQSFGRDQTTRRVAGDTGLDGELEADVFELAVVAGTTAVGASPSPTLRDHVAGLVPADGTLPGAAELFSETAVETLSDVVADAENEDVAQSAD